MRLLLSGTVAVWQYFFVVLGMLYRSLQCLHRQRFDTVGWASGRASGLEKLSDEVLMWLSGWSEVQIVYICIHCIPKPHHLLPHLNPDWFYLSGTGLPRLT